MIDYENATGLREQLYNTEGDTRSRGSPNLQATLVQDLTVRMSEFMNETRMQSRNTVRTPIITILRFEFSFTHEISFNIMLMFHAMMTIILYVVIFVIGPL